MLPALCWIICQGEYQSSIEHQSTLQQQRVIKAGFQSYKKIHAFLAQGMWGMTCNTCSRNGRLDRHFISGLSFWLGSPQERQFEYIAVLLCFMQCRPSCSLPSTAEVARYDGCITAVAQLPGQTHAVLEGLQIEPVSTCRSRLHERGNLTSVGD